MSIQTVTVPVPSAGQGTIADVSALTGQKTVVLTGRFTGYYDLLGSQDDINFVGLASFSAGGVESIRQTIPGSFQSVRLSANASPVGAPVTCEVSGVAGQNYFTTLATFAPGAGGSGAVVDTWSLFPLTGLENDLCFCCTGGFRGSVTVYGSLDGALWNAVGSFSVERLPEGSSERLTFPALSSLDKVRYLKVAVNGTVTSTVTVTFGGSVPVAAGSVTENASIITSLFPRPGNVRLQGISTTSSPVTDDRGNTVVPGTFTGDDAVCLGEYNTVSFSLTPTSGPLVVTGVGNTLRGNSSVLTGSSNVTGSESLLVSVHGVGNNLGDGNNYASVDGSENTLGNQLAHVAVVGDHNSVEVACNSCQAVGYYVNIRNSAATPTTANVFAAGSFVTVQRSTQVAAVGNFVSVEPTCNQVVALGTTLTVEHDTVFVVVVGARNYVTTACSRSVVVGTEINVLATCDYTVAAGSSIQVNAGSSHGVLAGHAITVGTNSPAAVIVGEFGVVGDNCDNCTVAGPYNTISTNSSRASIFGNNSQMRGTNPNCIIVGTVCEVRPNSSDCTLVGQSSRVGVGNVDAVVIGHGASTDDALTNVIVVGRGATGLASNTCTVGDSTLGPIHVLAVRGDNGGAIDTLSVTDDPADGETGLTVVYNTAGAFANKVLKASASPPVGALYAYFDP